MKKNKHIYYFLLILIGIIFFFLLGERGPVLVKDSVTYLDKEAILPAGYIIYPAFVRLIRNIFGEGYYVDWIFYIQSIIAMLSSIYVTEWFRKRFTLSNGVSIIVYGLSFLPYAYSLPEHVLSHEIMTEGLALPVFNLFMVNVLKLFYDNRKKTIIWIMFWAVSLFFIRPQLLTIVASGIVLIVCWGIRKIYAGLLEYQKKFFIVSSIVVGLILVFLLKPVMIKAVESIMQVRDAVYGKVLCVSEKEDEKLFEGVEQEIYSYLYQEIDSKMHRYPYFRSGVYMGDDIMNATNENAKDYIAVTNELYNEKYLASFTSENYKTVTEIRVNLIVNLLKEHFSDLLMLMIQLLPSSLVAAIFIQPESIRILCYIVSFSLYIAAVLGVIGLWFKKRESAYYKPMLVTMGVLLCNIILTNFIFYGQQRYVIYTFGWFYISGVFLLLGMKKK